MTVAVCEHDFAHWDHPDEKYGREIEDSSPYVVYQCKKCPEQDWQPKDRRLWDESGAVNDSWRYTAMYQWRYPSERGWWGYPAFRALSADARAEFRARLKRAASYEEGRAVVDEVLR